MTEHEATTAAPNIHKGMKGSMLAMTTTHPNHQAMAGRASQGAGATIGMRTERATGWARPPTTTGARKTHSTPGAHSMRSLMAQPVSARVITTTMPLSQRGNTTQGWQGRKHTNHQTMPHKNTIKDSKSYPHRDSNGRPQQQQLPQQWAILHTPD